MTTVLLLLAMAAFALAGYCLGFASGITRGLDAADRPPRGDDSPFERRSQREASEASEVLRGFAGQNVRDN